MPENNSAYIVEDDDHISYLVSFLLQKNGYQVTIADDGEKGMNLINNEAVPKLIILDVMMPFYNGFELLKHLKAKPAWKDVPVLMLTAKSQESDILRALESGASDYLVKPFEPMELLNRVKRIVAKP